MLIHIKITDGMGNLMKKAPNYIMGRQMIYDQAIMLETLYKLSKQNICETKRAKVPIRNSCK